MVRSLRFRPGTTAAAGERRPQEPKAVGPSRRRRRRRRPWPLPQGRRPLPRARSTPSNIRRQVAEDVGAATSTQSAPRVKARGASDQPAPCALQTSPFTSIEVTNTLAVATRRGRQGAAPRASTARARLGATARAALRGQAHLSLRSCVRRKRRGVAWWSPDGNANARHLRTRHTSDFHTVTRWKSNFGRPTPSTRCCLRSGVLLDGVERRIDATLSRWPRRLDGVEHARRCKT